MKMENNIRFAAQEDAEGLAKLGRETFYDAFVNHPLMPKDDLELYLKDAFSVSQITGELGEPQSAFLLAEIDGQAVGYAKLVADEWKPDVSAEIPSNSSDCMPGRSSSAGASERVCWSAVWMKPEKADMTRFG